MMIVDREIDGPGDLLEPNPRDDGGEVPLFVFVWVGLLVAILVLSVVFIGHGDLVAPQNF